MSESFFDLAIAFLSVREEMGKRKILAGGPLEKTGDEETKEVKEVGTSSMSDEKKETKKDRFKNTDVTVERKGSQIILPKEPFPMRYDEALLCLQRRMEEEESDVRVYEDIDAFPFDGAYAFMRALQDIYGWASPVPEHGFFGPILPVTVKLDIDFEKSTQIIWGNFKIPGIEGVLTTAMGRKDERPCFVIGGQVKKKHQADVEKIVEKTREILKTSSIYKGKAIRINTDDDGNINSHNPPKFLDLSRVNEDELTFSEDVRAQVDTNLFTPIENTESCRKYKIPLKRGVLLEGPYGTGKTLTAFVTAKKCVENRWTFILVDRVAGLDAALTFARMYAPAVVFAEDVDRAMTGERSKEMDDILNTIDGVESKGTEIITILTSNHVDKINKAMLRPGRLDAVISVQAPDGPAVQKLIRIYGRGLIDVKSDLTEAGKELAGQIPAVIREVVERAKLYAIGRSGGKSILLTGDDLTLAARGMKHHLNLLNPRAEVEQTTEQKLGGAFMGAVTDAIKSNGLYSKVTEMSKTLDKIDEKVS